MGQVLARGFDYCNRHSLNCPRASKHLSTIRIATRKSPLALWQARFVKTELEKCHPGLIVELLPVSTRGDQMLDSPLTRIGGKGLFVKELERALLEGQADIAVHSMKDVPMEFPPGLELGVVCERGDPGDAFVSNEYAGLDDLPENAILGTSSLRRQCQIGARRPDLKINNLRGNVNTRLARLDAGEYDAIVLAVAGLRRLGMEGRIADSIDTEICLPAGGQGAVGIECRSNDASVVSLLTPLGHADTLSCVVAERALSRHLQGGCQVPIACHAQSAGGRLEMRALVGSLDGQKLIRVRGEADQSDAEQLGVRLADELLDQGADAILAEVYAQDAVREPDF